MPVKPQHTAATCGPPRIRETEEAEAGKYTIWQVNMKIRRDRKHRLPSAVEIITLIAESLFESKPRSCDCLGWSELNVTERQTELTACVCVQVCG